MIRKCILATLPLLVGAALSTSSAWALETDVAIAQADTPKPAAEAAPPAAKPARVKRRQQAPVESNSGVPTRGMSMAQVERRFGAPADKLPAAGGDAPRHPTINRWRYAGYTVYFERNRVIHTVVDAPATTS